ncbi:oxygen-evolving enhancer protein 3-2, chloroplastic-like [Bidens hawaiensis]|uniref:oxygen-evolving enhancer protein 3-2, chloroplastic-like n=1 Tax=Bidens hawaiensis TaxID=980011 RepID=UPI00404A8E68
MAQSVSSMAGLKLNSSTRLTPIANGRVGVARTGLVVRASQGQVDQSETSRRAVLGLIATGLASGSFVQAVLADAKPIKLGPPPPPSGGLPGTLNSDEARDLDLPLKNRFYLQPLPPSEAAARAKESSKEMLNVKEFIDKKAWPYVQNDLRLKSEYLRFDLNTVIASKPKDEKKQLKDLTGKLFQDLADLDYAAKIKSSADAAKSYAAAVSSLNDVLSKLG